MKLVDAEVVRCVHETEYRRALDINSLEWRFFPHQPIPEFTNCLIFLVANMVILVIIYIMLQSRKRYILAFNLLSLLTELISVSYHQRQLKYQWRVVGYKLWFVWSTSWAK